MRNSLGKPSGRSARDWIPSAGHADNFSGCGWSTGLPEPIPGLAPSSVMVTGIGQEFCWELS